MSSTINLEQIVDATYKRLDGRVSKNEIRRSMTMIAARWYATVGLGDKWDVATKIGGNRYAATTYEILDALFLGMLETDEGDEDNAV